MIKKKIVYIATVHFAVNNFLVPHILESKKIFDVFVLTNTKNIDPLLKNKLLRNNVKLINIPFKRHISIIYDLWCIINLIFFFLFNKITICHSITPKAGLLSMIASLIIQVPFRIHTFTGQIWANHIGLKRKFFMFIDKIINLASTHIIVDSRSQKNFLVKNNIIGTNSTVLGNGSIVGVDTNKFLFDKKIRIKIRNKLAINNRAHVVLYLGRVNKDKGIFVLIDAIKKCLEQKLNVILLIVGPCEGLAKDDLFDYFEQRYKKKLKYIDYVNNPEDYMSASDIFCIPSFREGFGQVAIEASSCGLPIVASNIYGLKDSVIINKTGYFFKNKSVSDLASKIIYLINNKEIQKKMGDSGRSYVLDKFSQHNIVMLQNQFYKKIIVD